MKGTKVLITFLVILIELGIVIGIIAFLYKYTNGFNESLKTFTVKYGEEVLSISDDSLTLEPGETHRFEVGYLFDIGKKEERGYTVKIIPNQEESIEFEYRLNNEVRPYSALEDLTLGFAITQMKSSFEIYIPEDWSMETMMTRLLSPKGKADIPDINIGGDTYPFTLVVMSYNQKIVYNIDFNIHHTAGKGVNAGQ